MAETYVVTGGGGFIGSHIAERLLADGHRVHIVDNFSTGKRANLAHLSGDLHTFDVDITDRAALAPAFDGADYVFHEAALPSVPRSIADPIETNNVNVTGTLNVLLAARDAGVKRLAYAASSSAYGDAEGDFKVETMPPRPMSPYGVSKLAGEYYCQAFSAVYGLETVGLRYFNVFGPRQDETSQYSAVIPLFMTAMLKGKSPTIYGDGTQSRDFTYVGTVCEVLATASLRGVTHDGPVNLAYGGRHTLLDVIAELEAILGRPLERDHQPTRAGDVPHSQADSTLLGSLFPEVVPVGLTEGLRATVDWFRSVEAGEPV